jgi:plasmid stabilization system protein ParE
MSAYALSTGAALDLDDIWEYIAADSIDAADAVIYRAERLPIEIVAVTQGSRDIPAFLHQRTS